MARAERLALLPALILVLSGCIGYKEVSLTAVEDVQVERLDRAGLALRVDVHVNNPNGYRIKVTDQDVDLYLNGTMAGKATLDTLLVLEKRSEQRYSIPMHTTFTGSGFLLLLGGALSGGMEVGAKGTAVAKAGLVRKRFPFELQQRVEL